MKLSNKEKGLIKSRRKFISRINTSKKILAYRKASIPSKGEQRIIDFLTKEGVKFYREYFVKGLYNNQTKQLLYYDFYLPDYYCFIEYDGEQHYSKDKTENQKANDFRKSAYAHKNKLFLLRIKYTDFENIESIICGFFDRYF